MPNPLIKASILSALLSVVLIGCNSINTSSRAQQASPQHQVSVNLVSPQGIGAKIGHMSLADTAQGLRLSTQLKDLPAGFHGFHIHGKGSCAPAEKDGKMVAALAAGGHFNPNNAPGHGTPNDGHLGDLPVLNVDSHGNANISMIAPRLKLADIKGLAIMIHAGGDNYSDHPKPLGGGGDRIACGVI